MANEIGGISVKLSADVDASGAVKGYAQIEAASEKIQAEFKQTEAVAKSTNAAVASSTANAAKASTKATSAFKMQKGSMAQLGQQIQDVAVMSQFGADKFIILGTQGSQIASLFGPGGAVFGAVLAIAAAIGGTLVKSINAAGEAGEQLPERIAGRLEEIKQKFMEVDDASRNSLASVEMDKINLELNKVQAELQKASEAFDIATASGNEFAAVAAGKKLDPLIEKQKDLITLLERVGDLWADTGSEQGIDLSVDEGVAEGVQERIDAIRNSLATEKELYEAWRQTRKGITAGIISDEQAQLIQGDIAAQQRIESNFDNTIKRLEEERKLLLENQSITAEEKAALQSEIDKAEREAKISRDNALLQQEGDFQDAMTEIERQASEKRKALAEAEAQAKISALSDMFGNLSSLMNTESRKMFEIGKVAATAQAIVDGIAAVQGAYKVGAGIGGPALGAAYAAAAGAATLANIKQIQSTQYGSASTGQSYSGGTVVNDTATSTTTETRRVVDLNFTGNAPTNARELVEILNEAAGDNVQFNFGG